MVASISEVAGPVAPVSLAEAASLVEPLDESSGTSSSLAGHAVIRKTQERGSRSR
jgi:hypothetical protein